MKKLIFVSFVLYLSNAFGEETIPELLSPADFKSAPKNIIGDLNHRGCLIPQLAPVFGQKFTNFISGNYDGNDITDWSVICFKEGKTTTLVYWNSRADNVEEVFPDAEWNGLWVEDHGRDWGLGYARYINTVSSEILELYNKRNHKEYPEENQLRSYYHDGIENGFAEKGSTILYREDGAWIAVGGAD